ncbi:hypothetical protein LEL_09788 [Akanthomyces lecanii RCEF 1005]|uniref:C2H2-type domain-containing protein n=1 Tax=Akanthomyces lecanii RCEF 1005 TaxID=1081108 RepID=A0A162JJQ1_CORDF|nr:hypothetical protein LEL_09788 [Akanthomyces lecanii RCEF 1005]
MHSQSHQNIFFPDDGATNPDNGETPDTSLNNFLEQYFQNDHDGQGSFELFTGGFPAWTSSTGPVEAAVPTPPQQPIAGNADSSDESPSNQIYIQPTDSGNATQSTTQAIMLWQANVPINQQRQQQQPLTAMPSMTQNGPSPSSGSSNTLQRRSRERQERALRRSVAHARAHAIAPSPSTSSATSPKSEKGEYMRAKKVSKVRKREEKVECHLCLTELSGDHEYDRHFKLVHQAEGWRWQVIDPFEKGLTPDHPVPFEISECKNCQSGKLYGINYNAAAHIRRVHFKNTPNIDGGSKGGSSGGAWPEIRYLEYYYMKMVQVQVRDCSRAHRKTPKEGVDYVRTGLEKATPYREPSGKRQSSEGASDFSAAECQASHCNSFIMNSTGIGLSPSGNEQAEATPYTAEMLTAWPALAFYPQGNAFHPNDSPCGSYDLL